MKEVTGVSYADGSELTGYITSYLKRFALMEPEEIGRWIAKNAVNLDKYETKVAREALRKIIAKEVKFKVVEHREEEVVEEAIDSAKALKDFMSSDGVAREEEELEKETKAILEEEQQKVEERAKDYVPNDLVRKAMEKVHVAGQAKKKPAGRPKKA
jgi:hypothetical protein